MSEIENCFADAGGGAERSDVITDVYKIALVRVMSMAMSNNVSLRCLCGQLAVKTGVTQSSNLVRPSCSN